MRFKFLNKTWKNLILSYDFAVLHVDRNKNKAVSQISRSTIHIYPYFNNESTDLHLPFPFSFNSCNSIVGCPSKGLVCVCVLLDASWYFMVWNPATRKFRDLPHCKAPVSSICTSAGFDFRPAGGIFDYKLSVVEFFPGKLQHEQTAQVEVFTGSTNYWRIIDEATQLLPRLVYAISV